MTAFAVGDFYIAISLCYLLYQKRKGINHSYVQFTLCLKRDLPDAVVRSYLQRTRSMLDTMMLYTIETGLLTRYDFCELPRSRVI